MIATVSSPVVHALSFHAGYACRHSTACCTAPWGIALDEARAARVAHAMDAGVLAAPRAVDGDWRSPAEVESPHHHLLRRDDEGACVFLERGEGRCAIHRACGHDALPEACQQFPRVTLIDDRGIHVTLSHYCPTVTALTLADPGVRVSILTPPAGFARAPLVAGLDARGHWPPLLRPGVLCSAGAWSTWEAWVVDQLANGNRAPWGTLAMLSHAADDVRNWRSSDGDQVRFVTRLLDGRDGNERPAAEMPDVVGYWDAMWSAVPEGRATRASLDDRAADWPRALEAATVGLKPHHQRVGRYLAARAFASWCAYQGHGLRTHVASVRASLAVLVVELARELLAAPVIDLPNPDAVTLPALGRAMQQADWLLVHLAESETLARLWVEEE